MAKESEPRSKPITVSELIARSEPAGSAFPKSVSDEASRTRRPIGASGMPFHAPAEPAAVEDSEPGPEANVVTGIIPVVSDEPAVDQTAGLQRVPFDDLVGVELPAVEIREAELRAAAAETGPVPVVTSPVAEYEGDYTDPETYQDPETYEDDYGDEDYGDEDYGDDNYGDEVEPSADDGTEHRHVASSAELLAAQGAEDEAAADALEQDRAEKAEKAAAKRTRKERDRSEKSPLMGWLTLIGEVVLGLAVGAGLFWGFTELWKRYIYLALILAVVVIFAIVTFAHILRKRDLPTTLLALGVGMLVTIGPLVLLAA